MGWDESIGVDDEFIDVKGSKILTLEFLSTLGIATEIIFLECLIMSLTFLGMFSLHVLVLIIPTLKLIMPLST